MSYFKLQIGCLFIVLYIIYNYRMGMRLLEIKHSFSIFDLLIISGTSCLLFDGATAYTVNHLDSVNSTLNLLLHLGFFISIEMTILCMFIYIYKETYYGKLSNKKIMQLCFPIFCSLCVVIGCIGTIEYRIGKVTNYSMGISVYACYGSAAVYVLLSIYHVYRKWNSLTIRKRNSILTFLIGLMIVMIYQSIYPESLITAMVPTLTILSAYLNEEDPAMHQLKNYHEEMVMGFATLVESRDNSTGGHVKRTSKYAEILATSLQKNGYYTNILTRDYIYNIVLAASMHDIGKIAIPDRILQKPGGLTDEEYELMKQHTTKGGAILKDTFSRIGNKEYLDMAISIASCHHEKWNGQGYPNHLKGEDIPLCARIMAIVDVFDAVSANRVYRKGMGLEESFKIIEEGKGTSFEPLLVDVFLNIKDEITQAYYEMLANEKI